MLSSGSSIERAPASPGQAARPGVGGRAARALDFAERAIILALFAWLAVRLAPGLDPLSLGYLACEALVVIFVLCRRGVNDLDMSPYAVALAFVGTLLPLLMSQRGSLIAPFTLCAAMTLFGFGASLIGKLMLNRRFGIIPANRGVQINGPYRFVRHPIYLGHISSGGAFVLSHASAWNVLILGCAWTALALRIAAEEQVLSRDPEYRAYMAEVRWRLLPGVL